MVEIDVYILILAVWFLLRPFFVLVHEMGHAVAVLWLTGRKPTVEVGLPPWLWTWSTRRMDFKIQPWMPLRWAPGRCAWDGTAVAPQKRLWISLAGPTASLLLLLLFIATSLLLQGNLIRFQPVSNLAALLALFSLMITLVPWHYPAWTGHPAGTPSDGMNAKKHWAQIRNQK